MNAPTRDRYIAVLTFDCGSPPAASVQLANYAGKVVSAPGAHPQWASKCRRERLQGGWPRKPATSSKIYDAAPPRLCSRPCRGLSSCNDNCRPSGRGHFNCNEGLLDLFLGMAGADLSSSVLLQQALVPKLLPRASTSLRLLLPPSLPALWPGTTISMDPWPLPRPLLRRGM